MRDMSRMLIVLLLALPVFAQQIHQLIVRKNLRWPFGVDQSLDSGTNRLGGMRLPTLREEEPHRWRITLVVD